MINFRVTWRLKVRMKRSPLSCPSYWGSYRGRRRMWPQRFYWVFWVLGSRVLQHHHHPQSSRVRSRSRCLTSGSELRHNYNKTSICETQVTGNTHTNTKLQDKQIHNREWLTSARYSEENNIEFNILFHS